MTESKFQINSKITKVDDSLGLVFAWAIVCKVDGKAYFDLQDDNADEAGMLKAAADFMMNSRMSGDMHARDDAGQPVGDGTVVFAMPVTADIAKAFDITTKNIGPMIAFKPSPAVLAKYKDGTYTGVSLRRSASLQFRSTELRDEELT
jgi:hypothetical protein